MNRRDMLLGNGEAECRKHAAKHVVCKECMEACARTIAACQKTIA